MIIYLEIEKILNQNCKKGFKVLEIGGIKGGYLSTRKDIELIVSNIDSNLETDITFNAESIPYENDTFDLVFMVACDYFIKNINQAHLEIKRILKKDGVLIIASYKENKLKYLQNINKQEFNIDSFVYSKEEYNHKLKNLGFDVKNIYIKNNPPKSILKKLIWNFVTEKEKLKRSPWIIYKCLKNI